MIEIAFRKAFELPVDNEGAEIAFERKHTFLRFYEAQLRKGTHTAAQIRGELFEHYRIPENTFRTTASKTVLNLNAEAMIAFCKLYGYDIYEIYRDKYSEYPGKNQRPDINYSTLPPVYDGQDTIDSELPPNFNGLFYGYFFNSTSEYVQQGKIDQFVLHIISSHDIVMTLRHYAVIENVYQPREFTLRGKVIYNHGGNSPHGILAIAFHSEDDTTFCTLAYNKLQLNGQLYFRKGALLTQSRGGDSLPVIQSFIFTHRKIDLGNERNRRIVQGALTLPYRMIRIKKEKLEPFMDSDVMQKYFQTVTYKNAVREYIELDENIIQNLEINDRDKLYETLLQIRADEASPRLFTFSNSGEDRSWRYIVSLCEEDAREEFLEYSQEGPEV